MNYLFEVHYQDDGSPSSARTVIAEADTLEVAMKEARKIVDAGNYEGWLYFTVAEVTETEQ